VVLDSSAIIALLFAEPEATAIAVKLRTATDISVSAAILLEIHIVLLNNGDQDPHQTISSFLTLHGVQVVPFSYQHYSGAANAYANFGKRRHKAGLNYGDCMTYATAKLAGELLLFVGNDFGQTDIGAA
jgi:ribonuclease VapC